FEFPIFLRTLLIPNVYAEIDRVAHIIRKRLDENPCEPIDIFGLSRGAVYAVLLANHIWMTTGYAYFNKKPQEVRYLGIIDPVSTGLTGLDSGPLSVPSNVQHGLELIKEPEAEI